MRSSLPEIVLLCVLVCAASARAQLLDLGGGSAPSVDSLTAASELAAFLDAQAAKIRESSEDNPQLACSAAMRELAASMLRSGQDLGQDGAVRTLQARTIVSHMAAFDEMLAGGSVWPSACRIVANDLAKLAKSLPRRQSRLDRDLRDALSPITNVLLEGQPGPAYEPVAPLVPEGAPIDRTVLETFDALMARGAKWPSHASSVASVRAAVAQATGVLQPPVWVDRDSAGMLAFALESALRDTLDPELADRGLEALNRLADVARALGAVDALPTGVLRRTASERLLTLLMRLDTEPSRVGRVCRAVAVVFAEAGQPAPEWVEPWLPTQVRVAWRAATDELEASSQRLTSAMVELLDRSDPLVEPALLSALRGRRLAAQLVDDIAAIGMFLAGQTALPDQRPRGRPRVHKDYRRAAAMMLDLGRELGEPMSADEAREQITSLAEIVRSVAPMPGEEELRAAVQDGASSNDAARAFWFESTGGAAAAVRDRIDQRRQDVIAVMSEADPITAGAAPAEELDRLRWLMTHLHTVRRLTPESLAQLNESPLWELTAHGQRVVLADLPERLTRATQQALTDEPLDEDAFVTETLIGALIELQPATQGDGVQTLLRQVGLGTPDPHTWPGAERTALATICRDLEELASAQLRSEHERAERLEKNIATQAKRVLESRRASQ